MAGGPSIPQVLVDSLRARVQGQVGESLLEQAVRAAVELDRERRAWALVALAAKLRREKQGELARLAVEGAVGLDAGVEPTRAANTCAVALYTDDGDLESAVKLGEKLLASGRDAYLLQTMARVYWGLWKETQEDTWHDRWWRIHAQLHETAGTSP